MAKVGGRTIKLADHEIQCPGCLSTFRPKWSYVKKRWDKYCSKPCFFTFIKRRGAELAATPKICLKCGADYFPHPSNRLDQACCSIKCARELTSGSAHPQWKGGTYVGRKYRFIKLGRVEGRKHTCAAKYRGYLLEHLGKAEKVLGRCLKRGEVVHHINGDKLDNRNSNLLICTQKYHAWLHSDMSARYAREHFGREDVISNSR